MTVRPDNMTIFQGAFDYFDEHIILTALQLAGHNVHAGLVPFMNRETVIEALKNFIDGMDDRLTVYQQTKRVLDIIDRPAWVDITSMSDNKRRELNLFTNEIRETDLGPFDFPLRGLV